MAQVIYWAAAWVANAVLIWGGTTAAATFAYYATVVVGYAVIIGGSMAYSNAQKQRAARGLGGVDQSRSIMVRNSVEIRNAAVYGQDCLSGPVAYWKKTGSGASEYHYFVIILNADHPLTSIDTVRWGDTDLVLGEGGAVTNEGLAGYLWITKHLGEVDQAADAALIAASGGEWTSDHRLQGVPYLVVKLKWDATVFPNGLENVSAVVHGKKVFDLREGAQDPDDPSTWAWSENSALCAADYLHGELGAAYGTEINEDELIASATNSDEPVTLVCLPGTEKRYRTNGPVSSGDTPETNLNLLCGAMAGTCVFSGGEWFVQSGMYREPAMLALTVDDLLGPVSTNLNLSRKDLCNTVTGTFLSPLDGYVPIAFKPYQSVAAVAEDDGVVSTHDLSLPLTNSNSAAQRLAKIYCQRLRRQASATVTANLKAMQCRGGDVIPFTFAPNGWTAETFEVAEWKLNLPTEEKNPLHSVSLTLRQTDAGVYDWTPGTDEQCGGDVPTPGNRAPGPWSAPQIPPSGGTPGDPGTYPELGTLPSGSLEAYANCRMKTAEGHFCGIAEFEGHASDPPRFYKLRTLSGTVKQGIWAITGCNYDDGVCVITCDITGDPHFAGHGEIVITPALDGTDHAGVQVSVWATFDGNPTGYGGPWMNVPAVGYVGDGYDNADVAHAWPLAATVVEVDLKTKYADNPLIWDSHNVTIGGNLPLVSRRDVWDLLQDYGPGLAEDPPVCAIAETDNSLRYSKDYGEFPLVAGGTPGALPCSNPVDCYGVLVAQESDTATLRSWAGTEQCIKTGSGPDRWSKCKGSVEERLEDEDTIDAVVKRMLGGYDDILAVPNDELDDPSLCREFNGADFNCCRAYMSPRTGAEQKDLYVRESKVEGRVKPGVLIEGHDYDLIIHYYRRPWGSGAFVYFSDQHVYFTATADHVAHGYHTPTFYRVPNEENTETEVEYVEVIDVSE